MTDLATLKSNALGALNLVAMTNTADIESGFNGTFAAIHQQALDLVTSTQMELARTMGWLDSDDEPKPDAPDVAVSLWYGDASPEEVIAL